MYNISLGTYLVKHNPIYTFSDRPNVNSHKPVIAPAIRWNFYKWEFKNIFPHVR